MDREAIEEAIEVLEDASADMLMETGDENYYVEAIAVLRQALETEKQEPVAHVYLFDKAGRPLVAWDNAKDIKLGDKLYAAPKQWVGLTDEEVNELVAQFKRYAYVLLREVEAKLKEKNHG